MKAQKGSDIRCGRGQNVARKATCMLKLTDIHRQSDTKLERIALGLLLGAIFGFLWLMAVWLSGDGTETSERLAPTRLELGSVTARADDVAEEGPLLFQELDTVTGTRS